MDTQIELSTEQVIELMESGLNLTFSDEQRKILANSYKTPLLVNACAGSGKTTIFILMALVAVSKGIVNTDEILGVTFSHKSKEDMTARYRKYVSELANVGLTYSTEEPRFTTFHSLFFHLLTCNEEYQGVQVLSSYKEYQRLLERVMEHPDPVMTKRQMLKQMFRLHDYLINKDLIEDGIYFKGYKNTSASEMVGTLNQYVKHNQEHDLRFYLDYFEVMQEYEILKKKNNSIDFNDMKLLLFESMKNEAYLKQYQAIMSQYKLAIVDEFQDIDTLQWKIISKLLNKDTMNHLIAIGDDDQSIYSFRGSNPKYIMNYRELMPNVTTMNLSTNYRTGGQILKCAVPMIKKNFIRLDKSLLAFKSDIGKVVVYRANAKYPNQLLEHLVEQIKNPDIDNNEIAVLVRYNSSRVLAADWLANKNIYINLNNNKLVLQKNSSYKAVVGLMEAFWNDKFKLFYDEAKHIGFRGYLEHIDNLINSCDEKYPTKLSKYLSLVENNLTSLIKVDLEDSMEEIDVDVLKYWKQVQLLKCKKASDTTEKLFEIAKKLTANYFEFMTDHKYLSINDLGELFMHLKSEAKEYANSTEFFKHEKIKESILINPKKLYKQELRVQFLSLHQSKGLEFKHVYLYGLTDKEVKPGSLFINKYFHPNISLKNFANIFIKLLTSNLNEVADAYKSAMIGECVDLLDDEAFDLKNLVKSFANESVMQEFKVLYQATKKCSAFIEEERRLLYVGITRAKEDLNIGISDNCNPLLNELALPSTPDDHQVIESFS